MIATIILALAVLALRSAYILWRSMPRVTPGALIYSDASNHHMPVLASHRYRLSGKPDYAYRRRGITTPVEVKSKVIRRSSPRPWDVWQLMTYCVLLEDTGSTVHEGIVEYPDRRFTVPYDAEQKRLVLERAEAIRADRRSGTANRDHHDAWKCRACGFREACDQRLPGS